MLDLYFTRPLSSMLSLPTTTNFAVIDKLKIVIDTVTSTERLDTYCLIEN